MKKSWIAIALTVALMTIASVAVSIRAQKKSDEQRPHSEQHGAQPAHKETMQHADCPMMKSDKSDAASGADGHDSHLASVNERGGQAMGFSQTATTHHFKLTREGGFIQVEVNDPKDTDNLNSIRQHLAHIARMFAEGDFRTPMLVHDRMPPGVSVMERMKADIKYAYEETERGGRVRIETASAVALAAVHEFLRFQIEDHQTGDSTEVKK